MSTNLKLFYISTALTLAILFRPAAALPQENKADTNASSAFIHGLMQGMNVMDKDMMAAPMTGNPDHDFCAMMIPHHQGAIDMAKSILLHGTDPVVQRLAQEIIVTQEQEIEVMRLRLAAMESNTPSALQNPQSESMHLIPISSHDRVYTADQTSDTVSVIDPSSNRLLGVIRLGDPVPGALSPLYRGQLLVHGM